MGGMVPPENVAPYTVNPVRGCGRKVRGGSYLEADGAVDGRLQRMSWVLGRHCADVFDNNIFTDSTALSRRGMTFFNPAATLAERAIVYAGDTSYTPTSDLRNTQYRRFMPMLGALGVLDYVGDTSYNPWQFAEETYRLGPSRRVTRAFMLQVADLLPLPVFFVHRGLPFFPTALARTAAYARANDLLGREDGQVYIGATWDIPAWGMRGPDDIGDDHFMVPVLAALSDDETFMIENNTQWHGVEYVEGVFLGSWLTRAAYVLENASDQGIDHSNVQNVSIDQELPFDEPPMGQVHLGTENLQVNISVDSRPMAESLERLGAAMSALDGQTRRMGQELARSFAREIDAEFMEETIDGARYDDTDGDG
jgi:hypothetical protein